MFVPDSISDGLQVPSPAATYVFFGSRGSRSVTSRHGDGFNPSLCKIVFDAGDSGFENVE